MTSSSLLPTQLVSQPAALPFGGQPPPAGEPRGGVETRRAVEAFMREQVEQHAWLIDTEVAALRTWWPEADLCTSVAELVRTTDPRGSTWLLAQVDVDALLGAVHAADQLEAFQALTLDEAHVPILLECAVQLETGGARSGRRARRGRGAREAPCAT